MPDDDSEIIPSWFLLKYLSVANLTYGIIHDLDLQLLVCRVEASDEPVAQAA